MLDLTTFQSKMASLAASLPLREGSDPESDLRNRTYLRVIQAADLEPVDFIEACDRILFSDQWFPTISRIIEVTDECAKARRIRERVETKPGPRAPLACATCHGARLVRTGGYDSLGPPAVHAGDEQSRVKHCPRRTTEGQYDVMKERSSIRLEGGVPDPTFPIEPDMSQVTWPARMAELRDPITGKIDGEKVYRLSRELRGLDPDVDERPSAVPGWKSVGRELVGAT